MAGFADKFRNFFNNYEDEDYESSYFDEEEQEEPAPQRSRRTFTESDIVSPTIRKPESTEPRVVDFKSFGSQQVVVVKPQSMEDGQQIAKEITAGRIVICNFEEADHRLAQRIIDFLTGSAFALGGRVMSVSSLIFVLTPQHVALSDSLSVHEEHDTMAFVRKMASNL